MDQLSHCDFVLDEQIKTSSFELLDWPLSRVLLKNNADYPWFVLVPRRDITEMTELSQADRYQLIDEVHQLSTVVQEVFKPNKINMGALGNIVPQFHLHVVGRFHDDPLWPHGIWQVAAQDTKYIEPDSLIASLIERLSAIKFCNAP